MSVTKTTAFSSKEEELLQELHRYKVAYAEASSRADIASTIIQKQREELSALRANQQGLLHLLSLHFPFQFIVNDTLFLFKCEGDPVESRPSEGIFVQHTYTIEKDVFETRGLPERQVCTVLASLMDGLSKEIATEFLLSVFSTWESL
jgi:hypothetical protein